MAQISDTDLKQALADALGVADVSGLAPKWSRIVADANRDAWRAIQRALGARGYSLTDIDAWDDSAEFNRDIGLFWCLTRGGGLNDFDDRNVNKLDRRKELETCQVVVGGAATFPGVASTTKQVGRGDIKSSTFFPSDPTCIKW